ncbi:carotenoid biosynthesis protein [Paenibacillus sp. UNC499MF]|uniref:carotenoid biosynthesis protein n=1 Tax=Paenibacillus sp. UNC499MF TaxID=1502751 RepID=UPI0008A08252|nr:carotenoid biosynthesis protein [Paenibacillus sp. UNC499MF]SEG05597.1 putative membrane protein [Paenibacillus sp. UNC499MF]
MLKPLLYVYAFWFLCGFVLLLADLLPPWLEWANSVYLMLGGIAALLWVRREAGTRRMLLFLILCGGLSFFSEWFGSHTGLWFGRYSYTDRFAPLLFGVPLAIPMAWCLILAIAKWFVRGRGIRAAAAAGGIASMIDLVLDPVAVRQRYWVWADPGALSFHGVPWTNFACWWITASLIYACCMRWKLAPRSRLHSPGRTGRLTALIRAADVQAAAPLLLFVTLELLFLALGSSFGLWPAVLINGSGAALLLLWRYAASGRAARGNLQDQPDLFAHPRS